MEYHEFIPFGSKETARFDINRLRGLICRLVFSEELLIVIDPENEKEEKKSRQIITSSEFVSLRETLKLLFIEGKKLAINPEKLKKIEGDIWEIKQGKQFRILGGFSDIENQEVFVGLFPLRKKKWKLLRPDIDRAVKLFNKFIERGLKWEDIKTWRQTPNMPVLPAKKS